MKKIMFNDKYGLTDAVLQGRKTITRRVMPKGLVEMCQDGLEFCAILEAPYKVGEVVAVAQSYKSVFEESLRYTIPRYHWLDDHIDEKGYTNKMFVKAGEMPHQIRITDIKVERLQDITEKDCICEGVTKSRFNDFPNEMYFPYKQCKDTEVCYTPRGAFQILIDRVSGKGTWESNPWVFVYSFELVK